MFKTLIALILLLTGCNKAPKFSYSSQRTIKQTIQSVVKITTEYTIEDKITLASVQKIFFATGFSIATQDNVSYILTNQHVCDMHSRTNYKLMLASGEEVKATFIRVDAFADICLLKTEQKIPSIPLASNNASQGDRVISIGGPEGVFPMIVDGIISGYYNTNMKDGADDDGQFEIHFRAQVMSTPVYPGSSGSPVMNTFGEVVGIVFAGNVDNEHISYIVPISEVLRFIDTEEYVHMN